MAKCFRSLTKIYLKCFTLHYTLLPYGVKKWGKCYICVLPGWHIALDDPQNIKSHSVSFYPFLFPAFNLSFPYCLHLLNYLPLLFSCPIYHKISWSLFTYSPLIFSRHHKSTLLSRSPWGSILGAAQLCSMHPKWIQILTAVGRCKAWTVKDQQFTAGNWKRTFSYSVKLCSGLQFSNPVNRPLVCLLDACWKNVGVCVCVSFNYGLQTHSSMKWSYSSFSWTALPINLVWSLGACCLIAFR